MRCATPTTIYAFTGTGTTRGTYAGLTIGADTTACTASQLVVMTHTGLSVTLNWLKSQAVTAALGLPADVVGMLSVMKVGTCISIIFSAMLARLVINGLSGDAVKKWVLK